MQHFFYTNAHSCNGDVLLNLDVLNAWYNGINNTIIVVTYVQFDSNICVLYVFLGFLKIRPKIRRVVKVMQVTITGPQKLQSARLYSS
jgi:uncharacterized membrane protein